MPAAALAFAAAAAAPGSAAAPPSGLSHGVSTGARPPLPCSPGSVRAFGSLGRGLRPGGVAEGEAVLRAPGTRDPCLGVLETPTLLDRGGGAVRRRGVEALSDPDLRSRGLPARRRPTRRPAKRGRGQDGGWAGRWRGVSQGRAWAGPAARAVFGHENGAPSSGGGWRDGPAPRASILCGLTRRRGGRVTMLPGPRVPGSLLPSGILVWPASPQDEEMEFWDRLVSNGTCFLVSFQAFHGIQQQRCCNRQRPLRIKHIPRFQ